MLIFLVMFTPSFVPHMALVLLETTAWAHARSTLSMERNQQLILLGPLLDWAPGVPLALLNSCVVAVAGSFKR
jgi:hypothetical protein